MRSEIRFTRHGCSCAGCEKLGADCVAKEMRDEHGAALRKLLDDAGISGADVAEFKRYGSARNLYHFHVDNAGQY